MTARVTVEFAATAITRIGSAWRDLAKRCLEPSIFNEPGFVIAALEHLPEARNASLVAVWDGAPENSSLLGLCIIDARMRYRRPFPASAFLHLQATAAFPLLDEARAGFAFDLMVQEIARRPGRPAALLVHGLPSTGPTARLLGARIHHAFDSRTRAVLPAGTTGLSSGKDRKEFRRLGNRLAERGAVSVTVAQTPDLIDQAFQRFLRLEAKGWKGRQSTALDSRPALSAFGRQAVGALATDGLCRLLELRLDEQTIASGIVLRSRERAFFWKTAFDEAYGHFSPGVQLALRLSETMAGDATVAMTDSCAVPGHSMIDRVWPDRMLVTDLCVATAPKWTLAFALSVAAEAAARAVRKRLKEAHRWVAQRRS